MNNALLSGLWKMMIEVPPFVWEKQIEKKKAKIGKAATFMSPDHRRVHHFVVRELPRLGRPLPPDLAAQELDLPLERVREILQELEQHLTFLYRNEKGEVLWAYPVTVEKTPHRITFATGEQLYAA
jgi:hypothetical protein